ncbi:hypothetical protein M409DRAFT_17632 [Zasmidium cellare ATCC 36951]|uniref:Autophagy-related protein 13 n=1 Tax=Zasmidium cellare ATCC 36951 TaxID=1080233 RepID=A0A6A6D1U1_ZASCE|nr:uncharacterized protein M409DRAFT_17632 [Zasmidium cellare ATCC 36951]KAF2172398.1 hypothetical protein M409DRAFT_17632 [Zasmidium cellare ATCC 36951]
MHKPSARVRADFISQFNSVLDETDVISDDLEPWRRPDLATRRPPPLVIEVYLDTSHLSQNQALIIVDEAGKRHDVSERLQSSADSSPRPSRHGAQPCEVVIERWTIELGDGEDCSTAELNDTLPNVYKKGVCLFRSLFAFARFLPAWKLHRKLTRQPGKHQALRLRFRIKQDHRLPPGRQDSLYAPLCSSQSASDAITEAYEIPALPCRAGALSISVHYRTNCEFGVADSESLLSSRFLGYDEGVPILAAGRSLPAARGEQARVQNSSLARATGDQRARVGAYGSLGTFHAADKRGSPVTELKQRVLDEDSDDGQQTSSNQRQTLSREPSQSLKNNPPFKSGSLASSPRPSPSPSTSAGRESSFAKYAGTSSGKRVSLNTLPQQALRAPPSQSETAVASSGSSSPKPAPVHRYSSSFANRNRRYTPQNSKTGESGGSSGRASSSSNKDSKEKPLVPGYDGPIGSRLPGPSQDHDDIADFIFQVEKSKDVRIHSRPGSRDNTVNLTKYSNMRDPNTQLAEEMSSSSLIQTSATPPSRRLSNVPGLSTSSSPSRALTHAPHVRSRLSTHSIAEEITSRSGASGEGSDSPKIHEEDEEEEDEEPFIFPQDNV